jgi:hypothetical protein
MNRISERLWWAIWLTYTATGIILTYWIVH